MQEERERLVVRRFKFEEPRPEQIQDLEVSLFKKFAERKKIVMFFFSSLNSFASSHFLVVDSSLVHA